MSRALRLPALVLLGPGFAAPLWVEGLLAHMLGPMTLVALAAPLLVLAWPATSGRIEVPVLAGAVIEFAVPWGWHLPALHGAPQLSGGWFLAEQALFLLGGLAVWGALLLTSMHMTLLGALLVLAPSDLYAAICGTPPDVWAQGLGGLLMLGIGTPVYLVAGLAHTARALRDGEEEPASEA